MLADPRSETLATNFAAQWLHLRICRRHRPYERLFPDFDEGLRHALRRETELFFDSVVREDRSALDLLTRRLHVPQRAARRDTTASRRLWQPTSAA